MEDVYNDDHYLEGDAGPRSSPLLQSVKPDLYPDRSSLEPPSKELSEQYEYDIDGVEQDPWPGVGDVEATNDDFQFENDLLSSLDGQRNNPRNRLVSFSEIRETRDLVGEYGKFLLDIIAGYVNTVRHGGLLLTG